MFCREFNEGSIAKTFSSETWTDYMESTDRSIHFDLLDAYQPETPFLIIV